MTTTTTLEARLRDVIKDSGRTHRDVARAAGLHRTGLSKILTGRRGVSSLELALIADATGTSVAAILADLTPTPTPPKETPWRPCYAPGAPGDDDAPAHTRSPESSADGATWDSCTSGAPDAGRSSATPDPALEVGNPTYAVAPDECAALASGYSICPGACGACLPTQDSGRGRSDRARNPEPPGASTRRRHRRQKARAAAPPAPEPPDNPGANT